MANDKILEPPQDLFFDEPFDAAEYGRQHNLTVDSTYDTLVPIRVLASALGQEPNDPDGLIPWRYVPGNLIAYEETAEQWEISGTAREFLEDVCRRQTETDGRSLVSDFVNWNTTYIRRLKLELPTLQTDNEMDYRVYSRTVKTAREARLRDHHLPLEPVRIELDEGLEFPTWMYEVGDMVAAAAAEESFDTGVIALERLTDSLKSDWTIANERELLESEVNYHGVRLP